jgi:two-component sensor histidine kinase/HAMP domain-containing protein
MSSTQGSGNRKSFSAIRDRYAPTIRQKIIFGAISVLMLASFIYTFVALKTERTIMREDIIKKAEVVTDFASIIGELPLLSENEEQIKKAITSLKGIPEVSFVELYSKEKKLLAKEGDISAPLRQHPVETKTSIIEKEDYFDICTRVYTSRAAEDIDIFQETNGNKDNREPVGWVRIGYSKAYMKEAERSVIFNGLLIAVIFTLTSTVLLYKLLTAATKPLTTLSSAVKSVSSGRYPEIKITSHDEIGTLSTEFNRMSRTIQDREALLLRRTQLSAFVADIGMVLTQSEEIEKILQRCSDIMISHLDSSLARIWRYNDDKDTLELAACAGGYPLDESPLKSVQAGSYETGLIARNRLSNYRNDISEIDLDNMEWAVQNGIMSYAGCPLIVEDHMVGVMEMFSKFPMSEDMFYTLDSVSKEIALAVQHRNAELQIQKSLSEKEVLLREVHHRVKNNMQVISSLLNFQTRHITDQHFIGMLNESQNRIKSMALIHEKLYRSSDLSKIDFKDYINSLAADLFKFYAVDADRITLKLHVDKIAFEIDTAIPCGLLINELLTNALKHAFPEKRRGEINISLREKEIAGGIAYDMIVSDNGVGIPEDFDITKTKSLGLQLIKTLVEHQLQGKLDLHRNNGTRFHISFRELIYKKRL